MTANTLATTYFDIAKEVAIHLGWSRTVPTSTTNGEWTNEQVTDFGLILKEGYRQFLYPESIPGENKSHNWSFMYPMGTLALTAAYSTGTVGVAYTLLSDPSSSIATTTGTWPSWAATGGYLWFTTTGSVDVVLKVTSRTSDTKIVVSGDSTQVVAAGASYELQRRYYELPDDFGGMVSDGFTYRRDEQWHLPNIRIVGEGEIRKIDRATSGDVYPRVASLTPMIPVAGSGGTDGESSRWRASFYPRAEQGYNVDYRYYSIPPALSKTTNLYHYGGAEHSSTIIAAVLDVAFQKIRSSMEKHEAFLTRLKQSILHDRRNYQPTHIGHGSKSRGGPSGRDALTDFRSSTSTDNISTTFY